MPGEILGMQQMEGTTYRQMEGVIGPFNARTYLPRNRPNAFPIRDAVECEGSQLGQADYLFRKHLLELVCADLYGCLPARKADRRSTCSPVIDSRRAAIAEL